MSLDPERARLESALAALGPDDPRAAQLHREIGRLCHDLRDLSAAFAHLEQARSMHEVNLGRNSQEVATDCNHLALILHDLRDLDGAQALLEQALGIDESVLGRNHSNLARDLNNLAGVLRDQGDSVAATEALRWSLAIYQAQLGSDHPTTQSVARNLKLTSS